MSTIIYRNRQYRFRLTFPTWWRRHTFVVQERCALEDTVACISFNLRYRRPIRGVSSTNIFELVIFSLPEKEWRSQYEDSPFQFLGERGGRVFAAVAPGEPPEEFLLPDDSDFNRELPEFQWLSRMINDDLPGVLRSFRFIGNARSK